MKPPHLAKPPIETRAENRQSIGASSVDLQKDHDHEPHAQHNPG